ncbi:MAG: hypothetical protein AAFN91_06680 [Pseudomonadota bacterium]
MTLKTWTFAAIVATSLTACTPEAEAPEDPVEGTGSAATGDPVVADFMAFANESPVEAGASEADLSGLVASLPDYAAITWDAKSLDADSGATVFEGLSIGFGTDPQFGMTLEDARLWGYDDDLLVARLGGERLSESGLIFTRMEATNASYFGVDLAFNALFDSIFSQMDEDLPEGFEVAFERLESNVERIVVSNVGLRPWELSPLSSETLSALDEDIPPMAIDAIHTAQWLVAIGRSVSVEKSVSENTIVNMDMRQPGADLSMSMNMSLVAASGMRGFDIDTNLARGVRSSQTNAYSGETLPGEVVPMAGFPAGFTMVQAESYDGSSISNLRLDKLMGFLARSELPEMDERDLMSLGVWEVTGYEAQLNDKEILTAERGYFNGDQFEWIIPSDLSFGMEGAMLNTGELTGFFQILFETFLSNPDIMPEGDAEAAELEMVREGIEKAIELLPEHGLDKLPFDFSASAKWDADSGPTDFAMTFDADGFGTSAFDLSLSLPIYDALLAAYESEDRDAAFETAFQEAFAFRGARFFEEDKGGYDKLFAFANALGKEYPDQGWGAMLGNMEPAQLRTYLGTMMRMGKSAAAAEFPPAADWLEAYASYLESGGSFEVRSAPPTPITVELMDSYEDEPEPEEIIEIFGLTVTHTK